MLPSNEPSRFEPSGPTPLEPAQQPAGPQDKYYRDFFVVGIGASAGALEPISEILKTLPHGGNFAIVLVQHLDPNHASILVELLNRVSAIPVRWATNGQRVEPGNAYVAPPKSWLAIHEGILLIREPGASRTSGDVDHFLSSLAEDAKHRAVALILSGNGTDGTAGAKAVKGAGGIVLAQDPATASSSSMPRSAIGAGCVDRVLPMSAMAGELFKLTKEAPELWSRLAASDESLVSGAEAEPLLGILRLLAVRRGVDFNDYKPTTIKRRLVRQMMLAKCTDFAEYHSLLQKNRDEVDRLYDSLLINVTEFFRDPDYFDFLREQIIPQLLTHHEEQVPLRIWVPGCSTGEEVYSLAIIIRELLDERSQVMPVQIFATDVSDHAITAARAGQYSNSDVVNLSPERLKRFFHHSDRGYIVQKWIRDLCVFARQNVVRDPPFSRLDLISCRNLLIYLGSKLQRKLMPLFHYALNPGGILVLGSSESVGGHAELYRLVDRRFRIYARKSTGRRANIEIPVESSPPGASVPREAPMPVPEEFKESGDIIREADRIVMLRHAPSGVIVNEDLDIIQFRGDVSAYLTPTPGPASLNLFRMAREGLAGGLQAAINEAREKKLRVHRGDVRLIPGDGAAKTIQIDVTPIDTAETREPHYLVLFSVGEPAAGDQPAEAPALLNSRESVERAHVEQLRQDLEATQKYLQITIQKHETANQELRAANEEIQSSNEELQSTNEELETAKEELQSTNEELTTVNEELHSRQIELIQINNDLQNLINSVHLPIVILGHDMRIRRFTPMAEQLLKLIPTDVGRPLSDINIQLGVKDLQGLLSEVAETLTSKEMEVQDAEGRWFSLRVRPYKTADNKIDGVVLTLFDVGVMKATLAQMEEARNLAQAVIETTREPLAALTADLKIKSANEAFYGLFKTTKAQAEGHSVFEIIKEPNKLDALKPALAAILPTNTSLTNYEVGIDLPEVGATVLVINVRQIASAARTYPLILLSLRPR